MTLTIIILMGLDTLHANTERKVGHLSKRGETVKTREEIEQELKMVQEYLATNSISDITTSKKYYENKNTEIMARVMEFEHEGALYEDVYKANERIAINDYKVIVDQLTGFLLGNQPTVTDVDESITAQLPLKNMWTIARKSLKVAQIQKIAWIQAYVKNNKIKFTVHKHSDQIIPIYSDDVEKELVKLIYFYNVKAIIKDEVKTVKRVEVWDSETVTYYQENEDGLEFFPPDEEIPMNPRPHIVEKLVFKDKEIVQNGNSWGRVPFFSLQFNDEYQTMLQVIGKSKIDAQDVLYSDGANNFLDMAEAFTVLKGFQGDPAKALFNIKTKKAAVVSEGGGIDTITNEIPMVSREAMIKLVKKAIYSDGMGVDMSDMASGNVTNVAVMAYFANLGLKADNVQSEVEQLYNDMIETVAIFNNSYNPTEIAEPTIAFERSMIVNEVELMDISNKSVGTLSNESRWSKDPRVDDPEKEAIRVSSENMGAYGEE